MGSSPPPRDELIAAAIAAAPAHPILAEFKLRVVRAVQRSAAKAMAAAPRSCSELTDRLMVVMWDGGSRMRTSARAQHVGLVTPKFSRFMQERAGFFSRVSMLLLRVQDHASDALLYLSH